MTTTALRDLTPSELVLVGMLSTRRPDRSAMEEAFIDTYLRTLPGFSQDHYGNGWVTVGNAPRVLFSSHTDTVHREDGPQRIGGVMRPVDADTSEHLIVGLAEDETSNCLGGDNTVGVFLMREMILAGVDGVYVFHRGEESGLKGSSWVADNTPHRLERIDYAIAFDRRARHSIITHQMGMRTCSKAFANALAERLDMGHREDDGGSYTDTYSYVTLVPECTNVSAGFEDEHSAYETVDFDYVSRLRDRLIRLFSQHGDNPLPVERDMHAYETKWNEMGSGWGHDICYKFNDDTPDWIYTTHSRDLWSEMSDAWGDMGTCGLRRVLRSSLEGAAQLASEFYGVPAVSLLLFFEGGEDTAGIGLSFEEFVMEMDCVLERWFSYTNTIGAWAA